MPFLGFYTKRAIMNRKIIILIWVLSMLCCVCEKISAQDAMLSAGGSFSSVDGSVAFSVGQFAFHEFSNKDGSVAEGVQHPWEIFTQETVPPNYHLSKVSIKHSTCYNALQNITVAGDGEQVDIESTAFVEFIAGQSIRFLPGFRAQAGSYVNAYITTTATFCNPVAVSSIVHAEPVVEKCIAFDNYGDVEQERFAEKQITLYPNPNNGRFTLQLSNFDSRAQVMVVNLLGKVMHQAIVTETDYFEIDMLNAPRGVYTVVVSDNETVKTSKMVVY
jgi:hypothetical protein